MLCGFEYIDLLILYLGMSENVWGWGGAGNFHGENDDKPGDFGVPQTNCKWDGFAIKS